MFLSNVLRLCFSLFGIMESSFGSFTFQHDEFYITLHNNSLKTWNEANTACNDDGGDLASITSVDLQMNITSLLKEWEKNLDHSIFMGPGVYYQWRIAYFTSGRKRKVTDSYRWGNGMIVPKQSTSNSYENWYKPVEPNCGVATDCCLCVSALTKIVAVGHTFTQTIGKWVDDSCDDTNPRMYYICEVPTHYNPCYNGGNYVLVDSDLKCNCPSQYSGKLCEIFFAPNSNTFSNNFKLTCRVEGNPPPTIYWTISSPQGTNERNILNNFGRKYPFLIQNTELNSNIMESNLTVFDIGLCLGRATISCWNNSDTLPHQFQINQERYEIIGKSYFVFSETSTDINNNARVEACNKIGGELASITNNFTQNELIKVLSYINMNNRVWIGLHKGDDETWVWPNQQVVSYTNWKMDEPQTEDNCAFMSSRDNWKWEGYQCDSTSINGYHVCEVKNEAVPTFVSIENPQCIEGNYAMLSINWKLSPKKLNLTHEVKIKNVNNNNDIRRAYLLTELVGDGAILTVFENLTARTEYVIMISVALSVCAKPIMTSQTVVTGYVTPNSVQQAEAILFANNTCVVTWTWPTELIPTIANFIIKVTKQPKIFTFGNNQTVSYKLAKENFIKNVPSGTTSILFEALPNRVHKIEIYAQSCAGVGPTIVAQSECLVPRTAPSALPSLVFNGQLVSGTLSLSLGSVDETNGPVSCIFVIAQYHDSNNPVETNSSQIFLESLSNQNTSAITNGQGYLALALSSIPRQRMTINLGGGNVTSCDIHQLFNLTKATSKRASRSNNVYKATDLEIILNKVYSFYIVTTTPLEGDKVAFFAGPVTSQRVELYNGGDDSLLALIALPISLLLIFAVAAIVWCSGRQRKLGETKAKTTPSMNRHQSSRGHEIYNNVNDNPLGHEIHNNANDNPVYENVVQETIRKNTGVLLSNLKEIYLSLMDPDNNTLKNEFAAIDAISTTTKKSMEIAMLEKNKKLNRFKNILPFDSNRVVLGTELLDESNDYINASYIDGNGGSKQFIATQGPLDRTISSFWAMIWQNNCRIIIMLANLEEKGKVKCAKYWPEPNAAIEVGALLIVGKKSFSNGSYTVRKFQLTSKQEYEASPMIVTHYQYTSWPDHGIPVTATGILRLHRAVENSIEENEGSPIVVHCSAGAGRTGTFIAIDQLIKEMKSQDAIDIYATMMKLRRQRLQMIQTLHQYKFVHRVITEIHLFGDTDFTEDHLSSNMNHFESSSLEEFCKLDLIPHSHTSANENPAVRFNHFNYNASIMECYVDYQKMIAAETPTSNTVDDFWKCVLYNQVKVIVALMPRRKESETSDFPYWPNQENLSTRCGDVTVNLLETKEEKKSVTTRRLDITCKDVKMEVVQILYHKWDSEEAVDADELIAFLEDVDTLRSQSHQTVILIHCLDGLSRTGVFCALINLIERLKTEQRIDVFRTVKDLRDMRPGIIPTVNLYRTCYKVLESYLSSFSLYSNFSTRQKF